MSRFDPLAIQDAEVVRTNRLDRPYEVLSRPYLGRIIDTANALLQFQTAVLMPKKITPFDVLTPIPIFVNWGRIFVNCSCYDAPVADPEWGISCCLTCGRIYRSLIIPANFSDIESALMVRPDAPNRNWRTETLQQLLDENAAHGL